MAGPLRPGLLALLVAVLLAHVWTIDRVAALAPSASRLNEMPEAVFTRTLQPEDAPLPAPPPVLQRAPESRVEPPAPSPVVSQPERTPTQAEPEPVVQTEPAPAPPSVAEPPPAPTATAIAQADPATAVAPSVSAPTPTVTASAPVATPTATAAIPPRQGGPDDPFADWPPDTRLRYRVTGDVRGPLTGSARVTWQRVDDRYQVDVVIDMGIASARLTSQGRLTPRGLEPQVYEENVLSRRRVIEFRPAQVRLASGELRDRPDGVQDTASQFIAFARRFAEDPSRLAVGSLVPLSMARPNGIDAWQYDVVARERVPLDLDDRRVEVDALRLKPRPLPGREDYIYQEVWIAPGLQHLPVRVRIDLGRSSGRSNGYVLLEVTGIDQR